MTTAYGCRTIAAELTGLSTVLFKMLAIVRCEIQIRIQKVIWGSSAEGTQMEVGLSLLCGGVVWEGLCPLPRKILACSHSK